MSTIENLLQQATNLRTNYFNLSSEEKKKPRSRRRRKIDETEVKGKQSEASRGVVVVSKESSVLFPATTMSIFSSASSFTLDAHTPYGSLRKLNRANRIHKEQQPTGRQMLFCLAAGFFLAASLVCADYAQTSQQQQQQTDGYEQTGAAQQQQQPAKAKKIQIVYIKVPLNKLKPSLANTDQQYVGSSSNETAYVSQQDASTDTQRQGSQSSSGQLEQSLIKQQQQQASSSSFLIPMAVVQTESQTSSPSASLGSSPSSSSSSLQAALPDQQVVLTRSSRRSVMRLPMATNQQQNQYYLEQPTSINQGFMSGFLMAEKERMTGAALRLAANQQTPVMSSSNSQQVANPQASASTATQQTAISTQPQPQSLLSQSTVSGSGSGSGNKPGGLMPIMMMPFSHMPDNMIGQAYNAAVGQALPLESGSPMLSSSSNSASSDGAGKLGAASYQQPQVVGGNTGTHGDFGSSLSTGSSGSYGSNGLSQSDHSSSGNAYPTSSSASGAFAPLSGYGSGTNSFGASVAFSDFPAGSGAALASNSNSQHSSQQQQQLQHHQAQSSADGPHTGAGSSTSDYSNNNQKLRQAKKTIIPIVVQVEHAIMESNNQLRQPHQQHPYQQQQQQHQQPHQNGNRYSAHQPRGLRNRHRDNQHSGRNQPYGAASNEVPLELGAPAGAQYINAANAHDINQITAAINAENAASAAQALAQADLAFGPGNGPAYLGPPQMSGNNGPRPHMSGGHHMQSMRGMGGQYLQSAASVLLANTHPVLQAAASGGLASVSKLGAKLGEIMALPSMQVPNSIAALPSALSSITSQMGVQLNQAVQQAAKEHPDAHYFARQVAQHAGIQLPHFGQMHQQHQHQHQPGQQQQLTASGSQHVAHSAPMATAASQLQNLKLSIGQNLQSAAAQLIGAHQKANAQSTAAQMLANPLSVLYPPAVNSALKVLSAGATSAGSQQNALPINQQQQLSGPNNYGLEHHALSSSVQQQFVPANLPQQQPAEFPQQQQQQLLANNQDIQQQQQQLQPQQQQSIKSGGKTTLKSKFLSFFQPPKFFSNLLNWNERADERNDDQPIQEQEDSSDTKQSQPVDSRSSPKAQPNQNSSLPANQTATSTTSATVTQKQPNPQETKLSSSEQKNEKIAQNSTLSATTLAATTNTTTTTTTSTSQKKAN